MRQNILNILPCIENYKIYENFKYLWLLVFEQQQNMKIFLWEFVNLLVNILCLASKAGKN